MKSLTRVVLLVSFLPFFSVLGAVPPSQFQLEQLAKKRNRFAVVRIVSAISELEGEETTGHQFSEESVYFYGSRVLQSRVVDSSGRTLYQIERNLGPPIVVDEKSRRSDKSIDVFSMVNRDVANGIPTSVFLLFDNQLPTIAYSLIDLGVPVMIERDLLKLEDEESRRRAEKTFLQRWNKEVSWVIGEKINPKKKKVSPQLWMKKGEFLPQRLIVKGAELQFSKYTFYKAFPYPKEVRLLTDGEPRFKVDAQQIDVNPRKKLSPFQFARPGFTALGEDLSSSIKNLVLKYYEYLR